VDPNRFTVLSFPVFWDRNATATGATGTVSNYGSFIPATSGDFPKTDTAGIPQAGQAQKFKAGASTTVHFSGSLRIGLALPNMPLTAREGTGVSIPLQVVPLQPGTTLDFSGVTLDMSAPTPKATVSFAIQDPRLYANAENWVQSATPTLGAVNDATQSTALSGSAGSKYRYASLGPGGTPESRGADHSQTFGMSAGGPFPLSRQESRPTSHGRRSISGLAWAVVLRIGCCSICSPRTFEVCWASGMTVQG
jgi:hypothetical protein